MGVIKKLAQKKRNQHKDKKNILWFTEITIQDVPLVGGKNASLGEMYSLLTKRGVRVPNGFAITAKAYREFIEVNNLYEKIEILLKKVKGNDIKKLQEIGKKVRMLVLEGVFPKEVEEHIYAAYRQLEKKYFKHVDVAVRSSATAEDLPDASFAGQQETFLNVKTPQELLHACRKCFASLFTDRAIMYRINHGYDHMDVALSITVQKMARSDKGGAGVMFTIDTETGFRNEIVITAAYGLGELVVQGAVTPDEYVVFKPSLETKYNPITRKQCGKKEYKMIYDDVKGTKKIRTAHREQESLVLTDQEIIQLAQWGRIIEDHYSLYHGKEMAMDIEWAKDGKDGKLYIVQARPETVVSNRSSNHIESYQLIKKSGDTLLKGISVGHQIATGKVNMIHSADESSRFKKGDILVTDMTDPDWVPIMKLASAIITNRGGRTCHAAIVARELGVPAIVGTGNATQILKQNSKITVDCSQEVGVVMQGIGEYKKVETVLDNIPQTHTRIMLNIGDPQQAKAKSFLPVDGIGLARQEFIISNFVQLHPQAAVEFSKLLKEKKKHKKLVSAIQELTKDYKTPKEYYRQTLAKGVVQLASAFYPREVIVRLSDFKSNEYANLLGGDLFEPLEENPMIGWRGASRYYSPEYIDSFYLELEALRIAREEYGMTNITLMIPFCRTVDEAKKVLALMKKKKLIRGVKGLKVYLMCEIPSNVLLAEEFLEHVDGYSIGSNDLTQLILGVDRDSELVKVYDERNKAVEKMIREVVRICKQKRKYIGICGQAPSDYPEFAQLLVEEGISSLSLNPDSVLETKIRIANYEKNMKKKVYR